MRVANWRNWMALLMYAAAIPAAYLHPAVSLGLIVVVALMYSAPGGGEEIRD